MVASSLPRRQQVSVASLAALDIHATENQNTEDGRIAIR